MSLQDLQNDTNGFDQTVTHDDFLDQMLSGLQTTVSWPDISAANGGGGQNKSTLPWDVDHFDDQSAFLSSKLRQHQITAAGGARTPSSAAKSLQLSRGLAPSGESGLFQNDNIDDSSFKSPVTYYFIYSKYNPEFFHNTLILFLHRLEITIRFKIYFMGSPDLSHPIKPSHSVIYQ